MAESDSGAPPPAGDRTVTFIPAPLPAPATAMLGALQTPRNYEAGELHARGGMGEILQVRDRNLGRTVAMKLLQRGARAPDNVLRFVDEARITGRLEHPNIVPVHEAGVNERGEVFYTMKFVRGTTLRQVIDQLRERDAAALERYPLAALLTVFQKVCDAVAFAHSRGVLHRDLKPDNLMIGDYGEVLVMDWGLAKVLGQPEPQDSNTPPLHSSSSVITSARNESSESATLAGTVMGTPRYMAPEQARGEVEKLDARCDVYALGAILFELLALRPAVPGETSKEILANAIAGRIEPFPEDQFLPHCPGGRAPASLAAVAGKAMALRREDRYAGVPELQAEITRYQSGFATAAEGAGFGRQVALLIKRNRGIAATGFVAWLVITTLAVWFVAGIARERDRAEKALADLRATAPTFRDHARAQTEAQQFQDALVRIDTAILLDPTRAADHALRGNILQSLGRHAEAAVSFRQALNSEPSLPFAGQNLTLSEKLAAATGAEDSRAHEHLAELYSAMVEQKRMGEALALSRKLALSTTAQLPVWKAHITKWAGTDAGLKVLPDGYLSLEINNAPIRDLEPLRGLPIRLLRTKDVPLHDLAPLRDTPADYLSLSSAGLTTLAGLRGLKLRHLTLNGNPGLTDLTPLQGMPLEYLSLLDTRVTDLSTLKGMPLREFQISVSADLRDLAPLAGMPLESLFLEGTGVRDLSVVRGMPLTKLCLRDSRQLVSLEPLRECRRLEALCLPPNARDVEVLRALPALKIITRRMISSTQYPVEDTAEKFWAAYDAQHRP